MADTDTTRLCVQIVHSHFGPLVAAVAEVLASRGRLTLLQIVQFTRLKPRTVRAAILILVQQNILWHDTTEEEGEVLEINVEECLMRLRFGRFVWLAEELFGKVGGEIIQIVLDQGKLRPPDILSRMSANTSKGSATYASTLLKLVADHYLKPSTPLSHVSPTDRRIKYEVEEKAKISGIPTARQIKAAKEAAGARIKQDMEELEKIGLKRALKDPPTNRLGKRKMVEEIVVDEHMYFRVNFDKFNVHIRNKLIETSAGERFNESAALVMRALLKATESRQKDLDQVRSDPTTIPQIAMQLPDEVDLSRGLTFASSERPSTSALIKEYLALLAASDNPTPARACSFVSLSSGHVQVEFQIIAQRLRRRLLETVARERYGDPGKRILRLLLDTGKMDEKQISKVAMMAAKDVRPLLSVLSADSLVSIQEVPKSSDRNPTRMFYLWYVDPQRACSVLLANFYKTLYNISMRRSTEQNDGLVKGVLEKRERSDVSQDENLLTRIERDILAEWEAKREKLTVLEARVEEAIFILRDLGALGGEDE